MKLAAIYNTWSDTKDLVGLSMANVRPYVDVIIDVWSHKSNYGQRGPSYKPQEGVVSVNYEPNTVLPPVFNETAKRNAGLAEAKKLGCTHFIIMDGDEFYRGADIIAAKDFIEQNPETNGLVATSLVYFRSPKLSVIDKTLVPFIHKLGPTTKCGSNPKYPYAWQNKEIFIDPTRQLNYIDGIELTPKIIMHHYSWVRSSFKDKIENSTARNNIKSSTIIRDLLEAREGYFCEFYRQTLQRATVDFNIPELANETEISELMARAGSN